MKNIYAIILLSASICFTAMPAYNTKAETQNNRQVAVAPRLRSIVSPTIDATLTLGSIAGLLAALYIRMWNCYGTFNGALRGYTIEAESNAAGFLGLTCFGALLIKKNLDNPRGIWPLLLCSPLVLIPLAGLQSGVSGIVEATKMLMYDTPCFYLQTLSNLWTRK